MEILVDKMMDMAQTQITRKHSIDDTGYEGGDNVHHTPEFENPDAEVAHQIVNRFVNEGVLPLQFADRLLTQLTDGSMRERDWRSLAQQVLTWELEVGDDQ